MHFDFDQMIERKGTGCVKWDEAPSVLAPSSSALIPLWVADMDFAVAPAIQEAVRRRAQHPVFGYTHVGSDYYDAVISWFDRRHHWHIEREHILYTTGVVPAMSCAIKAATTAARFRRVSCAPTARNQHASGWTGRTSRPAAPTTRRPSSCSATPTTPRAASGLAKSCSAWPTSATATTCASSVTKSTANSSCPVTRSVPWLLSMPTLSSSTPRRSRSTSQVSRLPTSFAVMPRRAAASTAPSTSTRCATSIPSLPRPSRRPITTARHGSTPSTAISGTTTRPLPPSALPTSPTGG